MLFHPVRTCFEDTFPIFFQYIFLCFLIGVPLCFWSQGGSFIYSEPMSCCDLNTVSIRLTSVQPPLSDRMGVKMTCLGSSTGLTFLHAGLITNRPNVAHGENSYHCIPLLYLLRRFGLSCTSHIAPVIH